MKTSILRSAAIIKSRYEGKTAYIYASPKFVCFICVHNILYIYIYYIVLISFQIHLHLSEEGATLCLFFPSDSAYNRDIDIMALIHFSYNCVADYFGKRI